MTPAAFKVKSIAHDGSTTYSGILSEETARYLVTFLQSNGIVAEMTAVSAH